MSFFFFLIFLKIDHILISSKQGLALVHLYGTCLLLGPTWDPTYHIHRNKKKNQVRQPQIPALICGTQVKQFFVIKNDLRSNNPVHSNRCKLTGSVTINECVKSIHIYSHKGGPTRWGCTRSFALKYTFIYIFCNNEIKLIILLCKKGTMIKI